MKTDQKFFYLSFVFFCLILTVGCGNYKIEVFKKMLSIDVTYKTKEEMNKYLAIKSKMESVLFDSSNCYIKDYFPEADDAPGTQRRKIMDHKIDNILHSKNYDSLIVLVAFYAEFPEENGKISGETVSTPMKCSIDSSGKYKFDCEFNNFSGGSNLKDLDQAIEDLKTMMIRFGYCNTSGEKDPNYITHFFTTGMPGEMPDKKW